MFTFRYPLQIDGIYYIFCLSEFSSKNSIVSENLNNREFTQSRRQQQLQRNVAFVLEL